MLWVAEVALFIKNHWHGDEVNWSETIKATLLHDLGNIVKFDFTNYSHFLGSEIDNINYWKKVQKAFIKKYGMDDHTACNKILNELKIDSSIIEIIDKKSFGNSVHISKSNKWEPKLLLYSDIRISPNGIVTMAKRLAEVTKRIGKYKNSPDLPNLINACEEIEKQIEKQTNIKISKIKELGKTNTQILLNMEI